jgi:CRISPR-associated protein Csm1
MSEDGTTPARLKDLAGRAQGSKRWGVLRGDVDGFGARLRSANTVEEHVTLALSMKQFLTGEVRVLTLQGAFFRRISILWVGGDDFAVYGSWDALIDFAREIHRVFHRFAGDDKTQSISMALAVAPAGANDPGASFRAVYEEAGRALEVAKSEGKDRFHVLGRAIEWKQIPRSSDLKGSLIRLVREFGCSADFLQELSGFFQDRLAAPGRERTDRPWRYHKRISAALGDPRRSTLAFEKQKIAVIRDLIGAGSAQARLKPSGRVAVDWARLELGA